MKCAGKSAVLILKTDKIVKGCDPAREKLVRGQKKIVVLDRKVNSSFKGLAVSNSTCTQILCGALALQDPEITFKIQFFSFTAYFIKMHQNFASPHGGVAATESHLLQ